MSLLQKYRCSVFCHDLLQKNTLNVNDELMKRLVDIISKRLDKRNKRLIEVWVETFGVTNVSS